MFAHLTNALAIAAAIVTAAAIADVALLGAPASHLAPSAAALAFAALAWLAWHPAR